MKAFRLLFPLLFVGLISCTHTSGHKKSVSNTSADSLVALWVGKGQWLSQKGEIAKAIEAFEAAVKLAPEDLWLRLRLAQEYARGGRWVEAQSQLDLVLKRCQLDVTCQQAFELAIQVLTQLGNGSQLQSVLQEAVRLFPEHYPFHLHLMQVYLQNGEKDRALKLGQTLLTLKDLPTHEAHWYLAQVFAQWSDSEQTEYLHHLKKALDYKPDFLPAFLAYLSWLIEQKQWSQALKEAQAWQQREGYSLPVAIVLLRVYAALDQWQAFNQQLDFILQFEGDLRSIVGWLSQILIEAQQWTVLEKVLTVGRDQGWITPIQWNYLVGRLHKQKEDFPAAERFLKAVPSFSDLFFPAVAELVDIYIKKKEWEKAEKTINSALSMPKAPDHLFSLGAQICEKMNDLKCVEKRIEQGLKAWPESFILQYWQLILWDRNGESEKAVQQALKMIDKQGRNPFLLNFIAYIWAEKGNNLTQALEFIEEALQAQPQNGHFLDTKGWVLFRLGRHWEALDWLKKALQVEPEEAVIWEHIGDVYDALGEDHSALLYYTWALEKNPTESQRQKISLKRQHVIERLKQVQFPSGGDKRWPAGIQQ